MLALSASAWILLATQPVHVHHPSVTGDLWHWTIMVAAMMLPLQIGPVRLTAERSLWPRRERSIASFLAGYAGIWILTGVPLAWADAQFHIQHRLDWRIGAAIAILAYSAWFASAWKAAAARRCHRAPRLAPVGWQADLDCTRYGCTSAGWCVLNCWPLMIGCWLTGHNLLFMAVAFGIGWIDRHLAPVERLKLWRFRYLPSAVSTAGDVPAMNLSRS